MGFFVDDLKIKSRTVIFFSAVMIEPRHSVIIITWRDDSSYLKNSINFFPEMILGLLRPIDAEFLHNKQV